MNAVRIIVWSVAAIGYTVTAWEVLPSLWQIDAVNCIIVGIALLYMVVTMVNHAITREPLL
jgi:hypothetical protein